MITYCKNCDINWSKLWTIDIGTEDQLDICPLCGSDKHLEEAIDFVAFIRCPISGKIINPATGEELIRTAASSYTPPPTPPLKYTREEYNEKREARELEAILNYQKTGDPSDYFNTLKKTL